MDAEQRTLTQKTCGLHAPPLILGPQGSGKQGEVDSHRATLVCYMPAAEG